jgi:beta-glucosidase
MEVDIRKLISKMTLEEKTLLCSGSGFWHTKPIERLGIPSIKMNDGPHGLRNVDEGSWESVPATCFPTAVTLAASWDRGLVEKVGRAIGEECQAAGVSILLGPGVNIKRSPLCGRNFEYYSEDPFLSSEIALYFIKGVQSQGVGACIKHFCANNQEHRRLTVNAVIDERTLREIYLASFEKAVREGKPWAVMAAYNRVNGEYCSENKYLLNDILRGEWGFEGIVISDWGAVNERVKGLLAGLDLQMPYDGGLGDGKILEAVKRGEVSEQVLDAAVGRILKIVFEALRNRREDVTFDRSTYHRLAREAARDCFVLLKNEDSILPLKAEGVIALIGAFAKNPRYQGRGSSQVKPTMLDSAYDEICSMVGGKAKVLYADGYRLDSDEVDEKLLEEARRVAGEADVAILFTGLPERYESEGYDRPHMKLPESHNLLVEETSKVQRNLVVVLSNGAPVEMPWVDKVKAILETYLGGQAWGGAVADVLFGVVSPSGKLPETFPKKLSDNPSYLSFPGEGDTVEYREGIFVGYRYYDKKEMDVLFPFGHGLSYTTFQYYDLSIDKKEMTDQETLKVSVRVKNIGKILGKEVVQLYVRDLKSSVMRPDKELKGFEKVELKPGEEKEVVFILDRRAFAYYNSEIRDWYVEEGEFEILVGRSSRDIILRDRVYVRPTVHVRKRFHRNSTVGDVMDDPEASRVLEKIAKEFFKIPGEELKSFVDRVRYMPLRSLVGFSRGVFTEDMLDEILKKINADR